jgi:Ca2+-binding EF-hand superfamily protein
MDLGKAAEVVKQIKEACAERSVSFHSLFKKLDSNGNGLLSFPEFAEGIEQVIKLSPMVKEQLFALMDTNGIGMVDYDSFLETLRITIVSKPKARVSDNFDWEEDVIEQLRQYIRSASITPEEAFKAFDHDFDGIVSKSDLKWVLVEILKIEPAEIQPTKLERLFRLLDFYKTGKIQLSDIVRLTDNANPYKSYSASFASSKFAAQSHTFNWRQNALQQLGLGLSKKYGSVQESFEAASNRDIKIEFETFKKFLDKSQMLSGFNLTKQL